MALLVGVFLMWTQGALAQAKGTSDGKLGENLALGLFCDTKGVLEGDVGLLLGLILVFIALWSMIQGAKLVAVFPLLIIGSLMTALPSLIMTGFESLGVLLAETKISTNTKEEGGKTTSGFVVPNCTGLPSVYSNTNETPLPYSSNQTAPVGFCERNPGHERC